jgi:hypothetical protein
MYVRRRQYYGCLRVSNRLTMWEQIHICCTIHMMIPLPPLRHYYYQNHQCGQRIFQPYLDRCLFWSFSAPFLYHQERLSEDSSCEGPYLQTYQCIRFRFIRIRFRLIWLYRVCSHMVSSSCTKNMTIQSTICKHTDVLTYRSSTDFFCVALY